jgi:DNA-directed RNA polymerase subunit E'/Rpb7
MATTQRNYRPRNDQPQKKNEYSVYARNMISTKVHLKMSEIGDKTKQNLETKIKRNIEGKCIPEGFVEPRTLKIVTYSSGVVKMNMIEFQVVFECSICNPVEGQIVECSTKTITKAGIHAEVVTGEIIPMKIFVARDHNYANRQFGDIKEDEKIKVRIIGKRFELNDPYIVAIASLVENGKGLRNDRNDRNDQRHDQRNDQRNDKNSKKPKITVLEDAASNIEDEDEYVEPEEEEEDAELQAPISIPTLKNPSVVNGTSFDSTSLEEGEIDE